MKTGSIELLKKIMERKQTETDKIELGTLMLELYERVEDYLQKNHGIRIRLNLYEGVDACVYGNKLGIWLCLEIVLYSFIESCPNSGVIEFAMKNAEGRIWVFFSRNKEMGDMNIGFVNSTVKEYLDSQNILLRYAEGSAYEVKIGFCNMDGR